jgi:hypothetical protein
MQSLPDEVKLRIVNRMDRQSLINTCMLDREFSNLCKDESLWRDLTLNDFGNVGKIGTWYNTYVVNYRSRPTFNILIGIDGLNTEALTALTGLLDSGRYPYRYVIDKSDNSKNLYVTVTGLTGPTPLSLFSYLANHGIRYAAADSDNMLRSEGNALIVSTSNRDKYLDEISRLLKNGDDDILYYLNNHDLDDVSEALASSIDYDYRYD